MGSITLSSLKNQYIYIFLWAEYSSVIYSDVIIEVETVHYFLLHHNTKALWMK